MLVAAFVLSVILHDNTPTVVSEKFLAPPPEKIEYFHFGFRESVADSLWLRWIQDSDYCQTYLAPVQILKDESKYSDSILANPRHRVCDNSWAFKMLDAVTRLAPKFKMAYLAGATSLAVLVEDYPGASVIFNRGVENYPNEWPLLYRAAYHFMYDTQDLPRAAELLTRAADNGAPIWLRSLASRVYTQSGQLMLGITTLEAYRETVKDEKSRAEIQVRIDELKAKMPKDP